MKVLIIEDERIAADRLVDMLKELIPLVQVVAVLDSVEACSAFFKSDNGKVDLIFMDIELGDGQSFDVFDSIQLDAPVIFITAYQEHALRAFKLNSIDYLLKPLHRDELRAALEKFEKYHGDKGGQDLKAKLVDVLSELKVQMDTRDRKRFLAKSGTRLTSISAEQVAYFYTKEKYQYIKTKSNDDFVIDKRLDEIEAELDTRDFFRANRQFIVKYESVEKVYAWFSGKLKVQVNPTPYEEIIVSRLKAADFKKWLGE
jgi:two-component system, LytTR family, response regulator LytT